MKKLRFTLGLIGSLALVTMLSSCSKDDDDTTPSMIEITQAQLDAATKVIDMDLTGGSFPHGGTSSSGDDTYRDIYSSVASLTGTIAPGTIVTKHTWKAMDGQKTDDLLVSFAMVKREAGYDSANGDWEYIMIGFDAENDYDTHPFGMLANAADRGKIAMCIDCHKKAGDGDFLFAND